MDVPSNQETSVSNNDGRGRAAMASLAAASGTRERAGNTPKHEWRGVPAGRVRRFLPLTAATALFATTLVLSVSNAQADEKAAPKKSVDEANGKLVICGGGALPVQLRNRFLELAGGPAAHVVVVTTASVYADTNRMDAKLAFWREQQIASLTVLHTRSRQTANDPDFAHPLREATGVWFIGGNQNWLTETYLGTLTEQEIHGVLSRSGVVGGTSAGAAIMSPVMIRRDKPQLEVGPGFGFLPGTVVDQHFLKRNRQGRLLKVLDLYRNLVGLGIDEGTGVVVEGKHISVMGESQVVVCSPATSEGPESVQSLDPGAEADLDQLRTLVAQVVAKPRTGTVPTATASAAAPEQSAAEAVEEPEPAERAARVAQ